MDMCVQRSEAMDHLKLELHPQALVSPIRHGCWAPNSGPPQEQTAIISLAPLFFISLYFWDFHAGIKWNIYPIPSSNSPISFQHISLPTFFSVFFFDKPLSPVSAAQLVLPICAWVWGHPREHKKLASSHILQKEWSLPHPSQLSTANSSSVRGGPRVHLPHLWQSFG